MKLLNKYILDSQFTVKNVGTKAKIQIFEDELYLIVNFHIPAFPKEQEIFFETWFQDGEGKVVNPLHDHNQSRQYHGKDDGLSYILCQTGVFRMIFVVERYRKVKEDKQVKN